MNKLSALFFAAALVLALGACGQPTTTQTTVESQAEASSEGTEAADSTAADELESESAPKAEPALEVDSGSESSTSPESESEPASGSEAPAKTSSTVPAVAADGKQLATGTIVCTTYAERAAEVNYPGSDYAEDSSLLTLLVLDQPITVTAYHGGSDYTGEVTSICLPNDEMFRQFKDHQVTIGVDSWGEFPADISALLYDLVLDFDADGLTLEDPAL